MAANKALPSVTRTWTAAAVLLLTAFPTTASSLSGLVIGVADGDTLTVLDSQFQQHKIRLAGIDAPEKRQPFGQRSKQSLSSLAYGRPVQIDAGKTDKYGRVVGKVLVNGVDVNREQVLRGFAWHYVAYAREQSAVDRARYAAAESSARSERRGLWSIPNPTAPWDFRKHQRK